MTTAGAQFEVGARVVHDEFGPGTVRRTRREGRSLLVTFDSHPKLLLDVRSREVRAENGDEQKAASDRSRAPTTTPPTTESAPACGAASVATPRTIPRRRPFRRIEGGDIDPALATAAARTVEALRLGVVPHADLRASSVGRDRELGLVSDDLDQARETGAARIFLGDYGTGKTHLLELIEHEARARNFLVGRVTLDAQYVQPNQPMRIYRAAASKLRYPPESGAAAPGLEFLFRRAIADEELMSEIERDEGPFSNHLYLAPALHYFRQLANLDDPVPRDLLLDWISGQRPEGNRELDQSLRKLGKAGPTIYALKDFQPWAHIYSYMAGGLSALARRLGFEGLVLLLDEAENYDLLGSAARAFADSTFRCFVLAALGHDGVRFSESSIEKGGFGPQRRLPLLFNWPQNIYFVSAMTPSTAGEALLRSLVDDQFITELATLNIEDYHELSRRVVTLFEAAYPEMHVPAKLNRPLGDVLWSLIQLDHIQNPREATKLTIEFLDLLRHRPDSLNKFFEDVRKTMSSQ